MCNTVQVLITICTVNLQASSSNIQVHTCTCLMIGKVNCNAVSL